MLTSNPVTFSITFSGDEGKTHNLTGAGTGLVTQQSYSGNGSIEIENIIDYAVTTTEPKTEPTVERTARVSISKLTEREIEKARDAAGVDKDTEFSPVLDKDDNVIAVEFGWTT